MNCCKTWECSHILALKHLNGDIDLINETATIQEAKLKGRRRTKAYPMVGFSSCRDEDDDQVDLDYVHPDDLIGTRIRKKLDDGRHYNI